LRQTVSLGSTERHALLIDNLLNDDEELMLNRLGFLHVSQFVQVNSLDQFFVDSGLDVLLNTVRNRSRRAARPVWP
jgi:hypothetical protein